MSAILELDKVEFTYRKTKSMQQKVVFKDISLKFDEGEIVLVSGKSGLGKTTLLRLMAWLEEPNEGEIRFGGKEYDRYNPAELRKKVSLVPQIPVMMDGSVADNLRFATPDAGDDELKSWISRLDMEPDLLSRQASSISVGQRQRVAAIRNLLLKPKVLLLDEPTSGLDPDTTVLFVKTVRELSSKEGLTVIWNSHDRDTVDNLDARQIDLGKYANGDTE